MSGGERATALLLGLWSGLIAYWIGLGTLVDAGDPGVMMWMMGAAPIVGALGAYMLSPAKTTYAWLMHTITGWLVGMTVVPASIYALLQLWLA